MSNVALDRADQTGPFRRASYPDRGGQRAGLDRIAHAGAGTVGLHIGDRIGPDTSGPARLAHQVRLGGLARRHDAVGPPVLADRAAAYHGQHPVAVALGIGQPLERQHRAAFAADVAVGARVERL